MVEAAGPEPLAKPVLLKLCRDRDQQQAGAAASPPGALMMIQQLVSALDRCQPGGKLLLRKRCAYADDAYRQALLEVLPDEGVKAALPRKIPGGPSSGQD